jgi:hypothetical protein
MPLTQFESEPSPCGVTQTPSPLRAILDWKPISQVSRFLDDINYISGAVYLSQEVLKSHQEEGEDQDSRKVLEGWRAKVHLNNMSGFHEVST